MNPEYVILSEDDYVAAKDGNQREEYSPDVARASRAPLQEVMSEVERRGGNVGNPFRMLAITREVMFEKYEAEKAKGSS